MRASAFGLLLGVPPLLASSELMCNPYDRNYNYTCAAGATYAACVKSLKSWRSSPGEFLDLSAALDKCCGYCSPFLVNAPRGSADFVVEFSTSGGGARGSAACFCPTDATGLVEHFNLIPTPSSSFFGLTYNTNPTPAPTPMPTYDRCSEYREDTNWTCIEGYTSCEESMLKISLSTISADNCGMQFVSDQCCELCGSYGVEKFSTERLVISQSGGVEQCTAFCYCARQTSGLQLTVISNPKYLDPRMATFGVNTPSGPGWPPTPVPTPIPVAKSCQNANIEGYNRSCHDSARKDGTCREYNVSIEASSVMAIDCCVECDAHSGNGTSELEHFVSYSMMISVNPEQGGLAATLSCICQEAALGARPTEVIRAYKVDPKNIPKGVQIASGGSSLDECIVENRPGLMELHWTCFPDSCMASNLSTVALMTNKSEANSYNKKPCDTHNVCTIDPKTLSVRDRAAWTALCMVTIDDCLRTTGDSLAHFVRDCTYRASVLCDASHELNLDNEAVRCRSFALSPHRAETTKTIQTIFFSWPYNEGGPIHGLLPPRDATATGTKTIPQSGYTTWVQTDRVLPPTAPPAPAPKGGGIVSHINMIFGIIALIIGGGGLACCVLAAIVVVYVMRGNTGGRRGGRRRGRRSGNLLQRLLGVADGNGGGGGGGSGGGGGDHSSWRWRPWGNSGLHGGGGDGGDSADVVNDSNLNINDALLAPPVGVGDFVGNTDELFMVRESRLTPGTLAVLQGPIGGKPTMALAERVRDIAVDAVARGGGKQHGEQGGGGNSSSSSSNGGKTVATEVDRDVSLSGDGGGGGGGEVVVTRSPDSSGSGHGVGRGGGGGSSNRGSESTSEVSRGHTIDADDVEAAEAAAVYGAATGDARGMKMVKSGLWIAPKRIIVGRKIASGGFGAVRLGRLESAEVDARVGGGDVAMAQPATSRSTVVLKAIFAQIIEERDVAEFWHEAAMLAQIDHPHVIGFHGVTKKPVGGHLRSETSMQLLMVMEYAERGSLSDAIKAQTYSRTQFLRDATTISKTVQWLHARGIIHRDLKPSNVLVDGEGKLKLCDLGLARYQPGTGPNAAHGGGYDTATMTVGTGSAWYMPPEVFKEEQGQSSRYDGRKWDVYSAAILFIQLWTLRANPFPRAWNNIRIAIEVAQGVRPSLKQAPPKLAELIAKMWSHERSVRPSMENVTAALESSVLIEEIQGVLAREAMPAIDER